MRKGSVIPARLRHMPTWLRVVILTLAASLMGAGVLWINSHQDAADRQPAQTRSQTVQVKVGATGVPYGCVVAPDGTIDPNDPLCGTEIPEATRLDMIAYRAYYRDNPAYNCADGRNDRWTYTDLNEFEPCPNGSMHLRLTAGSLSKVDSTEPVVITSAVLGQTVATPSPTIGWEVRLGKLRHETTPNDDGTTSTVQWRHISYWHAPSVTPFMMVVRGTNGPWAVSTSINDMRFFEDASYDIVVLWTNPSVTNTPAGVPFDWRCMPNHPTRDRRC